MLPKQESLSLRLGALSVVLMLAAAAVVGYLFDRDRTRAMESRELEHVRLDAVWAGDVLHRLVQHQQEDLLFLVRTPSVLSAAAAVGRGEGGGAQSRQPLQALLLAFAEAHADYVELRLVAYPPGGPELIRVASRRGRAELLPETALEGSVSSYCSRPAERLPGGPLLLPPDGAEANAVSCSVVPVPGADGRPVALLVSKMDLTGPLRRLAARLHAPDRLYVTDEQGRLLHGPAEEDGVATPPVAVPPLRPTAQMQPRDALQPLDWGEGSAARVGFQRSLPLSEEEPHRRMVLSVARPAPLLGAEALRERWEALGLVSALLGAAALAAVASVWALTRSLRRLTRASAAVAAGDYRLDVPENARGEVGVLARGLLHMVEKVRSREHSLEVFGRTLEQRVEERTRELEASRAELRRQRGLQELVLEAIDDGVIVADRDGRFLLWNRKAAAILDKGEEEIPPERWPEHYGLHTCEGGPVIASQDLPLVRAIRGERTDGTELFLQPAGAGEGRWIELTGRPLYGAQGALEGGVITLVDVTERRRLRAQLQARLGALSEVGRLALMGEVTATVSHQLSQPVAAMANYAGAAIQLQRTGRLDDAKLTEILGHVARLATRAGKILEGLRTLTRRPESQISSFDVNEVVTSCVALFDERIAKGGVRLQVLPAYDLPRLRGDPIELEQVLMHLVVNALDALQQVPREMRRLQVRTATSADNGRVRLEVVDSGPGVPVGLADRVFEPWVSDKDGRLGIGLSIVRTMVDCHGGRVWTERPDEGGAAFIVELPAGRIRR